VVRRPLDSILEAVRVTASEPTTCEAVTPAETPTECEQYYERAPGYGNLLPSKKHDADLHARIRELEGALRRMLYVAKVHGCKGDGCCDYSVSARAALARSEAKP
jgi:hypothetical protein